MALTHEQAVAAGRLGAHRLHASGKTNTAPARRAFDKRFEDEVDPDRVLAPDVRAKRAEHARKAHFIEMAAKSAKARRKRQAS